MADEETVRRQRLAMRGSRALETPPGLDRQAAPEGSDTNIDSELAANSGVATGSKRILASSVMDIVSIPTALEQL